MTDTSAIIPSNDDTFKFPKVKGSSISNAPRRGSTVTIILKPHNASFQTRTLELRDKAKVRIGRQTSSKTSPSVFNGYFDSKVLSRQHAEIWYERSIVYIKDVKSSNGTFVNGQRLSNEGEESEPRELHHQDEIEFGIDIISETGSIMYHKVACSLYIFPMPLSQVDTTIVRELSNNNPIQVYPDLQALSRKSSSSSINSLSSSSSVHTELDRSGSPLYMNHTSKSMPPPPPGILGTTPPLPPSIIASVGAGGTNTNGGGGGGKKARKLESILLKLQSELEKSKSVEKELKTAREAISGLDRSISGSDEGKKTSELELKLAEANRQIKAFDEKWRHQNQAIYTAKQELHRIKDMMEKSVAEHKSREDTLEQALTLEKQKSKDLQDQINQLQKSSPTTRDNLQIKYAILMVMLALFIYRLCI